MAPKQLVATDKKEARMKIAGDETEERMDRTETMGFTLTKAQVKTVKQLAKYNNYHDIVPNSRSGIVRAAIDAYFENYDDKGFWQYLEDGV